MKLLAFSDLHCDLEQAERLVEQSSQADLVLGAGDFASVHRGLDQTIEALATIETRTLLVPGNNETEEALRQAAGAWPAAAVLHGEEVEHDGVSFFGLGAGVPVTPWDWSFDLDEDEADAKLASFPDGAVLVLHSPPKGYVDGHDKHLGSEAILRAIEARRPPLAVCGHIHESWGEKADIGETLIVNLGPGGTMLEI